MQKCAAEEVDSVKVDACVLGDVGEESVHRVDEQVWWDGVGDEAR